MDVCLRWCRLSGFIAGAGPDVNGDPTRLNDGQVFFQVSAPSDCGEDQPNLNAYTISFPPLLEVESDCENEYLIMIYSSCAASAK